MLQKLSALSILCWNDDKVYNFQQIPIRLIVQERQRNQ